MISASVVCCGNAIGPKVTDLLFAKLVVKDSLVLVDRQTAVVVDLSEQLAGKAALQEAAAVIAERLLPKLVKEAKEEKKP